MCIRDRSTPITVSNDNFQFNNQIPLRNAISVRRSFLLHTAVPPSIRLHEQTYNDQNRFDNSASDYAYFEKIQRHWLCQEFTN